MKAILEFNLPEEREEYNLATNAREYYCALFDLMAEFRKRNKYPPENMPTEIQDVWSEAYDLFWGIVGQYNVDI